MPTIIEVSKIAGVSKSTVSRVVSGKGYVDDETKERVLTAMREINYVPNFFARGMRSKKSGTIGILFPDLTNPFFADWYEHFEKLSTQIDLMNIVGITGKEAQNEAKVIAEMMARNVDALVVWSYCQLDDNVEKLIVLSERIPVVFMNSFMKAKPVNCVYANTKMGIEKEIDYLISLGKKRIGFISGPQHLQVTQERLQAYKDATELGIISQNPELIYTGDFSYESGVEAARYFLSLAQPPQAIMSVTDYMAIGAVNHLKSEGVRVPEDISVTGFDNIKMAEMVSPQLSTVRLPISDLARETFSILDQNLREGIQGVKTVKLDCTFIPRETT